jgi:hypothetical protein
MILIQASPSARHQNEHAQALQAGLAAVGEPSRIVHRLQPEQADGAKAVACWGWRHGAAHRQNGSDVLVMERGYLGDRFAWTSLAWNGLNGYGRVPEPPQDGGMRFRAHFGHLVKPWNPDGEYVLICGQVPGDQSLKGQDLVPWYAEQAARYRDAGHAVFFRPHPLAARRGPIPSIPGAPTLTGELSAALARAHLVVTYNSNTGVDALLAGKPTHVEDRGGMAYGIGQAERMDWLARLAWRQFTLDEIHSGFAWEHVRDGR